MAKGEYLSRIKWEAPSLDEIVMEPITVQSFGSTAIAVGTYREKQAKGGPPGIRRWRFIDRWVYKQTGWVLVAAATTAHAK